MSFDEDEKEASLRNASALIKRAEELAHNGKIKNSMTVYVKAIEIYLSRGEFLKMADAFNQLAAIAQTESQILPIMDKLRKIILTVQELNIPEEEAKLKLALAQITFKSTDFVEAGNLFAEVAELFFKADPEEYREVSGMFLLRAAECFERVARTEKSEILIINAIQRFDISNFNFKNQEEEFKRLIKKKEYGKAIEYLREIAKFFRRLSEELDKLDDREGMLTNLKRNVSARLLHMVSEYNFLKMVCYRYLKEEYKMQDQAKKSIDDLVRSIEALKEQIKSGDFSTSDLKRLTYDLFLLQSFQEYADCQIEDPLDLASRGLKPEQIESLKKLSFYEKTVRILELGLKDNLALIEDLDMGPLLNEYREFLINSLKI